MKSEKMNIIQKLEPHDPPVGAPQEGVPQPRQSPDSAFTNLLPDGMQDRFTLLPAEHVALHVLDLPIRSARQRRDAVPFALEEAVGRPLDQMHFAICETFADGRMLVAVVDRAVMQRLVEAEPDRPIVAEQMVLPGPEADATGQITWRSYRDGDRVLIRMSDGTGFAAHADMLPMLWVAAGKPGVDAHGTDLPETMTRHAQSNGSLPSLHNLEKFDLRQGAYRQSGGLVRPVQWLSASVALGLVLHLGLVVADVRAQRQIADKLQAAAAAALDKHLPSASADDSPELLIRQLASVSGAKRGSGFLPMMNDVSQSWLRDGARVQLRQLSWSDEVLRLMVETPDLEALQSAEASLSASGLRVSSGSITVDAGSAQAELTVRP